MKARTGIETDLCGKCFVACPYARRYVRRAKGLSAAQR
jgi:epoxyqueuosine reductase